jgi:glycosyltransferase involved in cell wall biosynthesis
VAVAPQAVDNAFWATPVATEEPRPFTALFVGRDAPEKGLAVLIEAWRRAALADGRLSVVGADGPVAPEEVRNSYAEADVLVIPSLATRRFLEPWGLVANEAMNQHLPVIATDAVGAAAGGLVRHERNGLVVPAGDPAALAGALRALRAEPALRGRLGAQAQQDAAAFTFAAWAAGVSAALVSVGAGAEGDR